MKQAVAVNLTIGSVPSIRREPSFAEELAANHGLQSDDVTAGKRIFPKDYWRSVSSKAQQLRQWFNRSSLPWGDLSRVIPVTEYFYFSRQVAEKIEDYHEVVRVCLTTYDDVVQERLLLHEFRDVKFPSRDQMEKKLRAQFAVVPIGSDWRTRLSADQIKEIEAAHERTLSACQEQAKEETRQRVSDLLDYLIGRLSAPDTQGEKRRGHFTDKMFSQASSEVDFLRKLTLVEDPEVAAKLDSLDSLLSGMSPESLRSSESERREKIARLREIQELAGGVS